MFKKLFVALAVVASLLFIVPSAQAANYELTTSIVGGATTLNAGTNYTVSLLVKNNTGSAVNLTAQWVTPQGLFNSGSVSLTNGVSVTGTSSAASRLKNVWFTLGANSNTTITMTVNGRVCIPNSGTFFGKLFSGLNSYTTLLANSNYNITGGTGRVSCVLDTTVPPLPDYGMWTALNRNTSYYEEAWFTIGYGSATSGTFRYEVSYAGRSLYDAGDSAKLYDENGVFVVNCTFDTIVKDGANCPATFWQAGATGKLSNWYTAQNITGYDYKIVQFIQGGNLQFSQYFTVLYS